MCQPIAATASFSYHYKKKEKKDIFIMFNVLCLRKGKKGKYLTY